MLRKENPIVKLFRWVLENVLWDFGKPLLSILISSVISFLPNEELLPMFEWYIVWPASFVLMYGLSQILIDVYNLFSDKCILQIVQARTDGVYLRNEGIKIDDISRAKKWIEKYDEWDKNTIKHISRYSKVESEDFKVINRMHLTGGHLQTIVPTHRTKINVLEEKLARLELLIERLKNDGK